MAPFLAKPTTRAAREKAAKNPAMSRRRAFGRHGLARDSHRKLVVEPSFRANSVFGVKPPRRAGISRGAS